MRIVIIFIIFTTALCSNVTASDVVLLSKQNFRHLDDNPSDPLLEDTLLFRNLAVEFLEVQELHSEITRDGQKILEIYCANLKSFYDIVPEEKITSNPEAKASKDRILRICGN